MSKHRKTRLEKEKTDSKHISLLQTQKTSLHLQSDAKENSAAGLYDTSHIVFDLFKTLILTFVIIAVEIFLFYALKNNVLAIPFISYR
ncbi:MAG: hypothetical protein A3G13_00500 [Candidatus Levybacteria bacterium RIFCSPLOWO2_12_FULL_37_7]|nr:MAG: hypothetical protein A3G13_00500 [Candidatus Levybacteria bacterium RIFCSPLOWO2_12_FULL_37_7]